MRLCPIHIAPILVLAGCAGNAPGAEEVFAPRYMGLATRALDRDLVEVHVEMEGARGPEDVAEYGACAAAQYALIRGYGFARHLRTATRRQGRRWTGNSVYMISEALPEGLRTIDAEVTVAACKENGIPTI